MKKKKTKKGRKLIPNINFYLTIVFYGMCVCPYERSL